MLIVIKTWIHLAMRHQGLPGSETSTSKEKRKHPIIWAFVLLCAWTLSRRKLHKEVYNLTKNELELLIADIGLMKIYQRTA